MSWVILSEAIDAVKDAIDSVKTLVTSFFTTSNTKIDGVQTTATAIRTTNLINYGSAVKSIQRGTVTATSSSGSTVTISSVTPSKCMVLINNGV